MDQLAILHAFDMLRSFFFVLFEISEDIIDLK